MKNENDKMRDRKCMGDDYAAGATDRFDDIQWSIRVEIFRLLLRLVLKAQSGQMARHRLIF